MIRIPKNNLKIPSPRTLFSNAYARVDTHFGTFTEAYGSAIGPKSDFTTKNPNSFFYKTSFVMVNDVTIANSYSSHVVIDSHLFGNGIFIHLMGEFNSVYEDQNSRWDFNKALLLPSAGNNKYESSKEKISGHLYINFNLERFNRISSIMSAGLTQPLEYINPSQIQMRYGAFDFKELFINLVKQIDLFESNVELLKLNAFDDQIYRLLAMLLHPQIFLKSHLTLQERERIANNQLIAVFEHYVAEHIEEPISLTELQMILGISARGLQYACQKHFGLTPREYIRNKRLDHIYDLLNNKNHTINLAHISHKFGFSSQSRFSHFFKQRFGILPSALIKSPL